MTEEFEAKSVMEMSGGAILERVNVEMARVIENILDPNAKAEAALPALRATSPRGEANGAPAGPWPGGERTNRACA